MGIRTDTDIRTTRILILLTIRRWSTPTLSIPLRQLIREAMLL
jgi:hypothetical protein